MFISKTSSKSVSRRSATWTRLILGERRIASPLICSLISVSALLVPTATLAQATYDVVYLRPPGGDISNVYVAGMDNTGNVLVETQAAFNPNNPGAYYYYNRAANSFRWIADKGSRYYSGLTDAGELIGGEYVDEFGQFGLYWASEAAAPDLLDPLPGDDYSYAGWVNNAGVIVGESYPQDFSRFGTAAWLVGEMGPFPPVPLPSVPGYNSISSGVSEPDANGVLTVLGLLREIGTDEPVGVTWKLQLTVDGLELLSGPTSIPGQSAGVLYSPYGVTRKGDVVGSFWQDFTFRAFGMPVGSNPVLLKQPKVGRYKAKDSEAFAVNDLRDVVGTATFRVRKKNYQRAILWRGATKAIDLNDAVTLTERGFLRSASRITNDGLILAFGNFPDLVLDQSVPCLLIPKE